MNAPHTSINDNQRLCCGMSHENYLAHRTSFCNQSAHDLAPGRIAVRVQYSPARVRGLTREDEMAALAVELRAPVNQLLYEPGAILDHHPDGALVAQSSSRIQS